MSSIFYSARARWLPRGCQASIRYGGSSYSSKLSPVNYSCIASCFSPRWNEEGHCLGSKDAKMQRCICRRHANSCVNNTRVETAFLLCVASILFSLFQSYGIQMPSPLNGPLLKSISRTSLIHSLPINWIIYWSDNNKNNNNALCQRLITALQKGTYDFLQQSGNTFLIMAQCVLRLERLESEASPWRQDAHTRGTNESCLAECFFIHGLFISCCCYPEQRV